MGWISGIARVLATLASIALSIGATHVADKIESDKSRTNKVSSDEIIKYIKGITSAARSQGNQILNQVYDRLAAIQLPFGMSSSLKGYLTDIKRKASTDYDKLRNSYSEIEQNLANQEERASNFAAQSDVVRNRNKDQIKMLADEASQEADKVKELAKGVENAIQK